MIDLSALESAARAATPAAWMHDVNGRVDVIHNSVRELWLKTHRTHSTQFMRERVPCRVEHYTIPLYAACDPATVIALCRIARAAVRATDYEAVYSELLALRTELRDAGLI